MVGQFIASMSGRPPRQLQQVAHVVRGKHPEVRGAAAEHLLAAQVPVEQRVDVAFGPALPVAVGGGHQDEGGDIDREAGAADGMRQALVECAQGVVAPLHAEEVEPGLEVVLVEDFARAPAPPGVAGGRLRIDPAQPVVVGRGEPAVPPMHEAVDPEENALPGARPEMVRGHGNPEQRGPLADRRAQFSVRGQEVVEAAARAHHEELLVSPGEPVEVRDDALAFLVDVRRGELFPDGPLRAELFQVQAAYVNVGPDGAQEHGESEADLPGHPVDARDEVEGEGRVPVAILGEVVVEEREAPEGGQVLSLEQFGQHEASPRRTDRPPGRARGRLGGRMNHLAPIPLDSVRHLAPGRDLVDVAVVRLIFHQRTENSTAVREVSPLLQPIVNREFDTGILRVIVLCAL